jgi:acetate kinase
MTSNVTNNAILAINSGSSTVKCALFTFDATPALLAHGAIAGAGATVVPELIAWIEAHIDRSAIVAVGHRIVHGGPLHQDPQVITKRVRDDLEQFVAFAPNHLPDEIAMIDAIERYAPGTPQVACFDTAFHQSMPVVARRLPIPIAYEKRGIRRYGFHGLSYAFLLEELTRVDGREAARGRVLLAHLGSGSSLAAVREGVSIDTTMGFTPIGGVVMSTRSGDLDPGVVTYLERAAELSADRVEDILSKQSGLQAISESTGDMQQLLARESSEPLAHLAVAVYVYSVVKAIGALTAVLGGLDTLVFSGGIGEHAAVVRARICDTFAFLGLTLDGEANARHAARISAPVSRIVARVIPTNEELMIARSTFQLVAG